jgi:hypothetical protein
MEMTMTFSTDDKPRELSPRDRVALALREGRSPTRATLDAFDATLTPVPDEPRPRKGLPARYRAALDLREGRLSPYNCAILEAAMAAAIAENEHPSEPRSREGLPAQYRAALDLWEGRPSPHYAILESARTPMPDDIANSRGR